MATTLLGHVGRVAGLTVLIALFLPGYGYSTLPDPVYQSHLTLPEYQKLQAQRPPSGPHLSVGMLLVTLGGPGGPLGLLIGGVLLVGSVLAIALPWSRPTRRGLVSLAAATCMLGWSMLLVLGDLDLWLVAIVPGPWIWAGGIALSGSCLLANLLRKRGGVRLVVETQLA